MGSTKKNPLMTALVRVVKSYNKVPVPLANVFAPLFYLIPENHRYGGTFSSEKARLERINSLSEKEIEAEEDESIANLVAYCYEHVPYYRELFEANGLRPEDVTCRQDLHKVPILTKEALAENHDRLLSDEFKTQDLVHISTSGSTGVPASFYVQPESDMRDWVYMSTQLSKFGFGIDKSRLVLRGKKFWAQEHLGRNWQWDALRRELCISIFNMTEKDMEEYCRVIEKYKPQFAYGYMSAMYMLCKYIDARDMPLRHHFEGFLGISESISNEQREYVEKIIGARVFSFYGMSERVIFATEDLNSTRYRVEPLYGIAELVDDDGNEITEPGVAGDIIGTGLLNYAMPLLRYRIGDVACWADLPDGSGNGRVFERIEGRKDIDVLYNDQGQPISMASLEVHSRIYSYMSRYQFVQDEIGRVRIDAVPMPGKTLSPEQLTEIEETFSDRTQHKIIFTARSVDSIRPKPNGKFSIVRQNCKPELRS